MKTKIFLAFIAVIAAALVSNFFFGRLILRDFDNYVSGVREDQMYWILASVEGGYEEGRWDRQALSEAIHWGMMMGLDIRILDARGGEVLSSHEAMSSLSASMLRHMEGLFHLHETAGPFETYPLYHKERQIGTLLSRPFLREKIKEKEFIFKQRAESFVSISLLIAGGGALLLALFLSRYLTRPLMSLKAAAEKIAKRDFSVRIPRGSRDRAAGDEVSRLSETFNMMAESLQKEELLRKRLMSNVAHELRTPLTIMKTHVEALADGVIRDREKGLETVHGEIDRLIKLVKGIEDVTEAEASFFTKHEQVEVNLHELLAGIAEDMQQLFREKGLGITVVRDYDLTVVTDVEKLEKIVFNILSNSLKYTDKGGVWIDYGVAGDEFFIEVRDTGRGIPQDELPRICDRFHRVAESGASGADGLGLGLAIVKELVEVMGGRIEVESKPGEGTRFRVYLPINN